MRLIDCDELRDELGAEVLMEEVDEDSTIDDIIANVPTVEAIPIDFLIKTQDEYCERYGPVHEIVVKNLIQDWRKEHEID